MGRHFRSHGLVWAFLALLNAPQVARPQAETVEDGRERRVMERFLGLLEKSPRRGTALDRVYGYHVERGTLDELLARYRGRAEKDAKDGTAWLMLGLLESQRGRDAAAVTALRRAEEVRPDDPLPPYYLGRTLVLVGQPDAAAEAFERAIARKPARADLLEIFQALGRVHQRAQRPDKALEVWTRLEKLFPDDLRVREQIAAALAEESRPEQALARYEALAGAIKDPYQRVAMRLEAADLEVRLGRSADALKGLEGLLGGLDPESWLGREVRRKVEDVFLRNDDLAGLAAYYTGWVAKHPEDVEAMARLGRTLADQGRATEARRWFDRAVKLAPSRRSLRQALIELLVREKKFAEAAAQYEAMARANPGNPDIIRDWGRLLLRDPSRPEVERTRAAVAVWRTLIEARPEDPALAVQVADLFRQAGLSDDAIALYKKAIALAPGSIQYHEYLGEYYHTLKRPDDAKAAWAEIAGGTNRTPKNLARLAEVLAGFGYQAEAVSAIASACDLDGDDFDLRVRHARLLHEVARYDDERAQLDAAARLADGEEQRETVLEALVINLTASGRLGKEIETLAGDLDAGRDASSDRWRRLARYLEAAQKPAEATAAIRKAVALDPKSVPNWSASARLHEGAGDLDAAADANRTLATLDRRNRTEYLTNIAKLESRLGRNEEALKAGRELLAAAPGNPEHYQFFADLCFGLGEVDQGLDALRRSVRLNPNDNPALLALAEALARQFRTEEAIELYWRAFDRAADLDARLSVVGRLTELYLRRNQFDRLVSRLEREQREADKQREMAICLAAAYQGSGDYGTARQTLERLAASGTRDAVLLDQLSGLAEKEGDFAASAKYQQQIVEAGPTDEASARLAEMLARAGEVDAAEVIWERLAAAEQSPYRTLQALDSLGAHDKHEAVVRITDKRLLKRPDDWEMLYRHGAALVALDRQADAARSFRALLALRVGDDEEGAIVRARKKGRNATARAPGTPAPQQAPRPSNPLQGRLGAIWPLRAATGLESRVYSGGRVVSWSPDDFGQARMAASAFLLVLGQRADRHDETLREFREAAARATAADPRPRWDWYYLNLARDDARDAYEAARDLARLSPNDPSAQWAYLNALATRGSSQGLNVYIPPGGTTGDRLAPLRDAEIDAVLAGFEVLRKRKPEWVQAQLLTNVAVELKRARRPDQEGRFYRRAIAMANTADTVASVLTFAGARGDVEGVLALYDKAMRLRKGRMPGYYSPINAESNALAQAMKVRADAKMIADVLRILEHHLAASRRERASAPRRASRSPWSPNAPGYAVNRFQVWVGKEPRYVQVDFPIPSDHFELGAIQLLREAFELYRRDDLLSDLFAHLGARAEDGPEADRVQPMLALAYLHWWNDEKDEALRQHERAGRAAKDDPDLRLELAELREKRGEPDEALAVADSVEPLDQSTMQRRELLALRLAVLTGNVGRARKAAERLFGLRLDADTQVRLAGQMHQLGMHDLAEAVLGRARRRAGNRSESLIALMAQYQKQDKTDLAIQVAHQLLRKSPAQAMMPGSHGVDDIYRQRAIQTLARSGKLKELIERAEAQLEASPHSMPIHQTLVDYYTADGQKEKIRSTYERMANLHPDDARLRLQIAEQMFGAGDRAAAIDHYRAAFRKEPALLGHNYWQIQSAFQTANRLDDLVSLYEEIDLRAMGSPWPVWTLTQTLLQDTKWRDRGLKLFRKAWQAFPTQRAYLIANLSNPEVWKLPELYEFVRESVLPAPGQAGSRPWVNLEDRIYGTTPDGKQTTVVTRLIEVAGRQNKLGALSKDLDAALKDQPAWSGGRAIRALVRARRGYTQEARRDLQALADDTREPMPANACWVVAQELEDVPALQDLAVSFYEAANQDEEAALSPGANNTPALRLVVLLQRAGRADDARRVLSRYAARGPDGRNSFDVEYAAYLRLLRVASLGQQFLDLGSPAEAIRLYSEILAEPSTFQMAATWGGRDFEPMVRDGLKKALQGLNRASMAATLRTLLGPSDDPKAPALDPVLLVYPRELDRAGVEGLLATTLKTAADEPDLFAEAGTRIARLLDERPEDLLVHIAAALADLAGGKAEAIDEATARLVRLVESRPLEALPPGVRANSRQRAEAFRQVGLWLVARECWKHESVRAAGDVLAERAIEAARRQADPLWVLAMLRERGQIDLDRGDRDGAERSFARMLDQVFDGFQPARPAGPAARPAIVPITLERFQQAMRVAILAARNEMTELSFRAVRRALRGGPPIIPPAGVNSSRILRAPIQDGASPEDQTARQVEARLAELETLWRERRVPAGAVYETLVEITMPATRPAEIFLFARPFDYRGGTPDLKSPRSVAALLARWAVRAGEVDDLRRRIEARLDQPTAALPGQILLAHLAREARDPGRTAEAFATLSKRLEKDSHEAAARLAYHVALPSLRSDATSQAALVLMETAVANLGKQPQNEPLASLRLELARLHFDRGDADGGRERLKDYLALLERSQGRPGGNVESANHQKRQWLHRAAAESARAGQWADVLDVLGQSADIKSNELRDSSSVTDHSLPRALSMLARHLATRPASERYETLRAWTLPTVGRKEPRLLSSFVAPDETPPDAFGKPEGPPAATDLASTAVWLIDAAREANRLDDLAEALAKVETPGDKLGEEKEDVGEKLGNLQTLRLLVEVARGRSGSVRPRIEGRLAVLLKAAQGDDDHAMSNRTVSWSDYLLARSCLGDRRLADLGERLTRRLIEREPPSNPGDSRDTFPAHLRLDMARGEAARAGAGAVADDPGLALWHPASHRPAGDATDQRNGALPPPALPAPGRWVEADGLVVHLGGPGQQFLVFDYPLEGRFEVSVETYLGREATGLLAYGGLVLEPSTLPPTRNSRYGNTPEVIPASAVWPFGRHELLNRHTRFIARDAFNTLSVRVEPGKVRYLVNGHLFYEDTDPSPTSPFLALGGLRTTPAAFRNVVIRGEPTIPRSVRLSHGDRLEGWVTSFYNERQPARRGTVPVVSNPPGGTGEPSSPEDHDWHARDGEIRGRVVPSAGLDPAQSRLYYHRPLRDGETLSYEFYYEPDAALVHPALDRLAFLLEPGGVRLHWMTDGAIPDRGTPRADNVADEPDHRRDPPALKPGAWNRAAVALDAGKVVLEVNGAKVFERPLEPGNDRLFGFYHDKARTAARVRNVVLKGPWPKSLDAARRARLLARREKGGAPADRRLRQALVGERFLDLSAAAVLRDARALPSADRYTALLDWVVPGESHDEFRLSGDFTPTDPPPSAGDRREGRRVETGGEPEAPALELVAVARALDRLDELAGRVEEAPTGSDRGRLALLALVRAEQGHDEEADAALKRLKPLLVKVPADVPDRERWPELLAASRALTRPALRPSARALLDILAVEKPPASGGSEIDPETGQDRPAESRSSDNGWLKQARHAQGLVRWLDTPEPRVPFGDGPDSPAWSRVTHGRALTRGEGHPRPHWSGRDGEWTHFPGHDHDALYLNVPLRGEFEFECEMSAAPGREVQVVYGGLGLGVQSDRRHYELFQDGREVPDLPIDPEIRGIRDRIAYRLVVKDGSCTAYVNGRQVHDQGLPADPDPWLSISSHAHQSGGVRGLKIRGRPTVPDRVELSRPADLTGWLATYYDESIVGDRRAWEKRGDEIFGGLQTLSAGSEQESVLQYHRPIVEDGAIEYAFFFEPGKVMVHPALDRLAFLLAPDGVKVHWLTDAQYDRSGLSPENAVIEPAHRRGPDRLPLRPHEWNRLGLSLVGDTATLTLNGVVVYERPIEPTNQRLFGLFHYADETEARVRDVVYRGNWPRAIPVELVPDR